MKVSILLISNIYPSSDQQYFGIFVKNIENLLRESGFIVNLSVKYGNPRSFIVKLWRYILFFINSVYKGLSSNYDIIYVHYIAHSAIPALIVKLFKNKIKMISHIHGGDILNEPKIFKVFTSLALNISDLVIVPSDYFKHLLIDKFNIKKEEIKISPSGGVDISLFKVLEVSRKEFVEGYRGELILGFISRIDKGKGWDVFLQAINNLRKELNQPLRGVIIGDGEEVDSMLLLKSKLNLNEVVDYLGPKKQDELPYFYNCFDLFIFPTERAAESLGLVGLEAMACGVPVIGGRIGGIVTYIKDGRNGYTFTPGSVNDLCKKIILFCSLSKEEKGKMRKFARKTVFKYDSSKVSNSLKEIFMNLLII